MPLSTLPLSYCTNVHPGLTVAEVESGLDRYAAPIAREFGKPMSAGLWLAEPVVRELLSTGDSARRFADRLTRRGLTCHTLNAFPYGNFHDRQVKQKVYLPDWADPRRLTYTAQCAQVLTSLLPDGVEGSISTLPLGFKGFAHPPHFQDMAASQLIECARGLDRLRVETGRTIRLAIEPEPFCVLETTDEAIAFFQRLWRLAETQQATDVVREHLGLCFDVCHQAVEFEDVAASICKLDEAGVRINKVHISCALQLDNPATNRAGREALMQYVEPRYLHQTIGRTPDGELARAVDLTERLISDPPAEFAATTQWRVHFHVPVDAEHLGPLSTTRPALRDALGVVAKLSYAPHLEVETYTWEVLPATRPADLVRGLSRELAATDELLSTIQPT